METGIEIVRYRGSVVDRRHVSGNDGVAEAAGVLACWRREGDVIAVRASASENVEDLGVDLVLRFPDWSYGYVLVPGAVYDGNRFRVQHVPYPPMYPGEEHDGSPAMTDIPRLSSFHLLAGDVSYPGVGLYDSCRGLAYAVLFPDRTASGPVGFQVEEGGEGLTVRIQFPGVRTEGRYTMVATGSPCDDRGVSVEAGWSIECKVFVNKVEARGTDDLFALLEENRNQCVSPGRRHELRPLSSVAKLVTEVTTVSRWRETPGYFETADSDHGIPFQVGWVGGGITTFPLLESEDGLARLRARLNVDFICEHLQGPSGFYYGGHKNGRPYNDGFDHRHAEHWTMVRKNGDMLLFLLRQILSVEAADGAAPGRWIASVRACADAFARTWAAEGQLGQFVDVRDGRVVVRGSACGGTAIAGLALASKYFGESRYLDVAGRAGEKYGIECVGRGMLNGGPGEILKAPDSESAFGLLEGYIVLWETTNDNGWLDLARRTARQAASWVVPYDFEFPPESTFGKLGMRTQGTVIANVQNKHSAPGICTLSALSLVKLFRATGERRWLDLAVDISHALPQFVSSEERPITANDGRPMPAGWVNERVNMSDWEAPACGVGEVFYGPCWAMTSVLLTALEIPGIYVDLASGTVACADHVEAELDAGRLEISNPTEYDAVVKVLVDRDPTRPLGELWWRNATLASIPPRGRLTLAI